MYYNIMLLTWNKLKFKRKYSSELLFEQNKFKVLKSTVYSKVYYSRLVMYVIKVRKSK